MIRFFYVLLLTLTMVSAASGQYKSVEVGVDGFTCSMCGMSVENAIRKLPFVSNVEMDLNKNSAIVSIRPNKEVSILQIAEQVYASGFSVRYLQANYEFPSLTIQDHSIFQAGREELHFLDTGEITINGTATIIFLNKKLISRKDYTRWEEWIKKDVKKNGRRDNTLYVTLKRG